MRNRLLDALSVGLAVALYFCIVLPLQSYAMSAGGFEYSVVDLLIELSWCFVAVLLALFGFLYAMSYVCGSVIHMLALGVLIAAYAESTPLSAGLPPLNGDFSGYQQTVRGVWDALTLVSLMALPFVCFRWTRRHVAGSAFAFALFTASSMMDVFPAGGTTSADSGVLARRDRLEVVNSVKYSDKDNVLLLIMDSISSETMSELLRDPQTAARFPGFTHFSDNTGMQWMTALAIPALLTGEYLENLDDVRGYENSCWATNSVIHDYLRSGRSVYVNLDIDRMSAYTNRPLADSRARGGTRRRPTQMAMDGIFRFTVVDLCLFRIVPYALKQIVAARALRPPNESDSGSRGPDVAELGYDNVLWKRLASALVEHGADPTFQVHHSYGGHLPVSFRRNGSSCRIFKPTYSNYLDQCAYSLGCVADMFDVWRTNGVYDASTIVLLADHAVTVTNGIRRYAFPPQAYPFLMVKPKGETGQCVESDVPTTHEAVAPFLRRLADQGHVSRDMLPELLSRGVRRCRLFGKGGTFKEMVMDKDGKVRLPLREIGIETFDRDLVPVELGMEYSLNVGSLEERYLDFAHTGGNRIGWDGVGFAGVNPMVIRIRMPLPCRMYKVVMKLRVSRDGVSVYPAGCQKSFELPRQAMLRKEIPVKSDSDGYAEIRFECRDPAYGCFSVNAIVVNEVRETGME